MSGTCVGESCRGLSGGLDMWPLQGKIRGLPGSPDVHPDMDTGLENWTMFTFPGYAEQEWNLFSFPNPHNVNSFSSWVQITPFYVFPVCTLSSCVSWKIIFSSQWSICVQNIDNIPTCFSKLRLKSWLLFQAREKTSFSRINNISLY